MPRGGNDPSRRMLPEQGEGREAKGSVRSSSRLRRLHRFGVWLPPFTTAFSRLFDLEPCVFLAISGVQNFAARCFFFSIGCFSHRHRDLRRIEAVGTVEMPSEIHRKPFLNLNMRTYANATGTGGDRSKRLESRRKPTNRLRLVRAWQHRENGSENWRSERKNSTIRFEGSAGNCLCKTSGTPGFFRGRIGRYDRKRGLPRRGWSPQPRVVAVAAHPGGRLVTQERDRATPGCANFVRDLLTLKYLTVAAQMDPVKANRVCHWR